MQIMILNQPNFSFVLGRRKKRPKNPHFSLKKKKKEKIHNTVISWVRPLPVAQQTQISGPHHTKPRPVDASFHAAFTLLLLLSRPEMYQLTKTVLGQPFTRWAQQEP